MPCPVSFKKPGIFSLGNPVKPDKEGNASPELLSLRDGGKNKQSAPPSSSISQAPAHGAVTRILQQGNCHERIQRQPHRKNGKYLQMEQGPLRSGEYKNSGNKVLNPDTTICKNGNLSPVLQKP